MSDRYDRCEIHACERDGVNLVRRSHLRDGELVQTDVVRCRTHTHRFDRVILGPGATDAAPKSPRFERDDELTGRSR